MKPQPREHQTIKGVSLRSQAQLMHSRGSRDRVGLARDRVWPMHWSRLCQNTRETELEVQFVKTSRTETVTSTPKLQDCGLLGLLSSRRTCPSKGRLLPLTPIKSHHAHSPVPTSLGSKGK